MNGNTDFDRIAQSWLQDGPTEMRDRSIQAALDEVHMTSQQRFGAARRTSNMNDNALRLAGSAAAALLIIVVGGIYLGNNQSGGVSGPPAPSASTAPSAAVASAAPSTATVPTPRPTEAVAGVCTPTPIKFDPKAAMDLTGAWAGDDGGVVYLRQVGTVIWWNSMSNRDGQSSTLGRDWNNVGRGEIHKDLTITSEWVDVPRGGIDGQGTVNFRIGPDSAGNVQITKTSETGTGRGDAVWTRCQPGFPPR